MSIAAVIAASASGLIRTNPEATEPATNANQVPYERVLSEQELDSLDDSDRQVILARAFSPPVTPPTNRPPRRNSMAPTLRQKETLELVFLILLKFSITCRSFRFLKLLLLIFLKSY